MSEGLGNVVEYKGGLCLPLMHFLSHVLHLLLFFFPLLLFPPRVFGIFDGSVTAFLLLLLKQKKSFFPFIFFLKMEDRG